MLRNNLDQKVNKSLGEITYKVMANEKKNAKRRAAISASGAIAAVAC